MGLLSTEVEVALHSSNVDYYEILGYTIPRRLDKNKKMSFQNGTTIFVKTEDLPNTSRIKVDVECDCCHGRYQVYYFNYVKSQSYHDGKVYCNHCIQKVFKKHLQAFEKDRRKFYPEYTTFIRNVLKRDLFTCKCCGNKHENLEVHHLDGYDWCVEKRIDETNAITLCQKCHSNFHSKYGRGNNTKEQFEEWMGFCITLGDEITNLDCSRKLYCYEENKIYDSANIFADLHKLKSTSSIYKVCNNIKNHKTVKGFHIFWYDEFLMLSEEQLQERIFNKQTHPSSMAVVLLETEEKYDSIKQASRETGANDECIRLCCHHVNKYTKLKDGTKGHWMFYSEFLNNREECYGNDFRCSFN